MLEKMEIAIFCEANKYIIKLKSIIFHTFSQVGPNAAPLMIHKINEGSNLDQIFNLNGCKIADQNITYSSNPQKRAATSALRFACVPAW